MAGPKTYRGLRGVRILSSPADVQKFSYDREPAKEDLPPPEPKKKRVRKKKKVLAKPKAAVPKPEPKAEKKSGPKPKKKAPVKKKAAPKPAKKKVAPKKKKVAPKKKRAKSKPKPIVEENYKEWSFKDLYDLAVVFDIPGRSGMLKGPLIRAVKKAERKSR